MIRKIKKLTHSRRAALKIDGLPVRNLKKKIKLVISEKDCATGNKKQPNSCAAALAAVRQVPHCLEARIHVGRIYLKVKENNKEFWLRGKTTGGLRTEIATFDRGGAFEPGIYDINPLAPSEIAKDHGIDRRTHRPPPASSRKPRHLKNVRTDARLEYVK